MFGHYRLDGLLGRGGMGEVYRAFDTRKRDRLVALKLLPEHLSADEQFRARFQREAEVAATLSEPHVIPIHDYGEIDGRLYLDMRVVEGKDLATVLHCEGPLSPERAVGVVEQVAAALDAAHAHGLIHRDVKPSNILVTPGPPEFVYLVDFGIARAVHTTAHGRITGTGLTVGTWEYMAPERFVGDKIDPRVDVYALACVLFETLTGRPPYVGEFPALWHGHTSVPVPALAAHRPGLPPALDAVIARGMAKDPTNRFGSAGALTAAARGAVSKPAAPPAAGTRGPATPRTTAPGPPPLPRPPRPRSPLRGAWLIAGAVLGIVVSVLAALLFIVDPTSTLSTLTGHTNDVFAVATAQLDNRPVIISGSGDNTIRVWDLHTGAPVGKPVTGHSGIVVDVATAQLDNRPVIISGSGDNTIRIWDLHTHAAIGQPLTGHTREVVEVTTAQLNGRPVIISGSADNTIRVWDLATHAPIGQPVTGTAPVNALATFQLNGRPVIVSASTDKTIRIWDLATQAPIGEPLTGHTGSVVPVATAQLNGRPVIISGSADNTIRVWDLATHAPVGKPLTGHTATVLAVATAQLGNRPVIISGSRDNTIRVWDLAAQIRS